MEEIVRNRDNSYIEVDGEGNWRLKEDRSMWHSCQNCLAAYGFSFMNLLVYNPRNMDFLLVDVDFEKEAYLESLGKLNVF